MRLLFMGRIKTTIWMRISRMWCKHENTFSQSIGQAIMVGGKYVDVVTYWQCHSCGMEVGWYQLLRRAGSRYEYKGVSGPQPTVSTR
jgi:hypothetical protein